MSEPNKIRFFAFGVGSCVRFQLEHDFGPTDDLRELVNESLGISDESVPPIARRCLVLLKSQVANCDWDRRHMQFLVDATRYLSEQDTLDESTITELHRITERNGLNPFRGTVSADEPEDAA